MASFDISFCANMNCKKEDCRRHRVNMPIGGLCSVCMFNESDDTDDCEWYWEGGKKK